MKNIDRVTTFIRRKYPDQVTLRFYYTDEGLNYYLFDEDSFWRVVNYVDSVTFDASDDLSVIQATGKAFGNFQTQLSDFDGSVLYETIPDFHNTAKRLDTLFAHVEEDPCGRVAEVLNEIEYISSVREKPDSSAFNLPAEKFPSALLITILSATTFSLIGKRKNR
jgi:hypothetical protein